MLFAKRNIVLLQVAAIMLAGTAWADQVTLKNGDRITGSVVKKDGANLTVKTDQLGVIVTPWEQVTSIRLDAQATIVLQDGRSLLGTISTTNGRLAIVTRDATLTVTPADIVAIRNADEQNAYERLQNPGWGQLWAGSASLGFAGTAGNARTMTLNGSANAVRETKKDKTSVYFNAIKSSAFVSGRNSDTAQAVRGGLAYDYNLTPRLFLDVFNDYEYDRFQALDIRFVIGAGVGYHALKTTRSTLDVLGGVDFNHSSYSTPLVQDFAEGYLGETYNYKFGTATTIFQDFRIFGSFNDMSAYRVNAAVGASTKISKWLSWNVSLSDRYVNHPAPGRKTNDFLYITGLGITFSR